MKLNFCKLLITVTLFTTSLFTPVNDVACNSCNMNASTEINYVLETLRVEGNMMQALMKIKNTACLSYNERSLIVSKLMQIHQRRDIDPEHLIKVIYKESRWNPAQPNLANSGAVGLIQWTKSTLAYMGYTSSEVLNMTVIDQLDLVDEYIEILKHKLPLIDEYTDLYLLVFYPRALGESDEFIIAKKGTKKYLQNKGVDMNRDGIITVNDFKSFACI